MSVDDVDVERSRRRHVELLEGVRDDASRVEVDTSRRKNRRRSHKNDRRLQAALQAEVQISVGPVSHSYHSITQIEDTK